MEPTAGHRPAGEAHPPPFPAPSCAACADFRAALAEHYLGRPVGAGELEHASACAPCAEFERLAAELSCRDFVRFLDAYLEGELTPERRATFERHLTICDDCVRYLESYRATVALGHAAFEPFDWRPLAAEIPAELLLAFRRAASDAASDAEEANSPG